MLSINVFGDFCVSQAADLHFADDLRQMLQKESLNVVNVEAPVRLGAATGIEKVGPWLSHDEGMPCTLEKHGFNVITMANNHAMDFGAESLLHTISLFKNSTVVGAGAWDEAYKVKCVEIEGKKIGFLGLTHNEFGVLDGECHQKAGTAWMLHPCVSRLIVSAKKDVDYLFVLPHAGVEHEAYPLPELRTLYREFVELGADGVFASHPHIPQGWEFYREKPIFYSLGNFCLDPVEKRDRPFLKYGLLISLSIQDSKIDVNVHYTKYDHERKTAGLTTDEFIVKHIEQVNEVMQDEKRYLAEVDAYCERILAESWVSFARSGYFEYDTKRFVKQIVRNMLGKQEKPNPNYLINTMRCESHRWAILRALQNRKNSKYGKN